ncbi:MAG: uracil phosphoribosyltransferase [Planctomycetes bacterium]|nr:uracil phosphoribosyltransferase [Planctomycetota bacterium]
MARNDHAEERAYERLEHRLCELPHRYGPSVHILPDPFLLTHLARLCAPETVQPEFNELIEVCYRHLLVHSFNHELPRACQSADTRMIEYTPRGRFRGEVIDPSASAVTVAIARAGTFPSHICYDMLNRILRPENVRQDHVILNRVTDPAGRVTGAQMHGGKVGGPVGGKILFLPDPMAATGASILRVLEHYRREVAGVPAKIVTVHLIATPEFIRAVKAEWPAAAIYAVRLDRGLSDPDVLATVPGTHWDREFGLDERQYIVPGGGGFGEILNNAYV